MNNTLPVTETSAEPAQTFGNPHIVEGTERVYDIEVPEGYVLEKREVNGGRRLLKSVVVALLLLTASAAQSQTVPANPLSSLGFFPVAVWLQNPALTGHSGSYANSAAAAAGEKMNIFIGLANGWPETFGGDQGELAAIKGSSLYLIGGSAVPYNENTSHLSVASIMSLAATDGAQNNLIGYNAGDEPQCAPGGGQIAESDVPGVIAGIHGYDSTRIVALNQTDWMIQPQYQHQPCLSQDIAALQATSVASMDVYPVTSPYQNAAGGYLGVTGTDYAHVSNDALWVQGLSVQGLVHYAKPGQPIWAYIEAGGDNFGLSAVSNTMAATVTAGSPTITATGPQRFTGTWIGLAAAGSTIASITDSTHAVLASPAATSATSVAIGSGVLGDCVPGANLCVVNGNEYRPTPAQVSAEVWMSIINGATGIEYFCHDSTSYAFCLNDTQNGGSAAATVATNLNWIDTALQVYAAVIDAPTVGICSMQAFDYSTQTQSTTPSCSNGSLTLTGSISTAALAKSFKGATYVIMQPGRRGSDAVTIKLNGLGGHTATVVYDTDTKYDNAHTSTGSTFTLDASGSLSDTIGANSDAYEVKIYKIN